MERTLGTVVILSCLIALPQCGYLDGLRGISGGINTVSGGAGSVSPLSPSSGQAGKDGKKGNGDIKRESDDDESEGQDKSVAVCHIPPGMSEQSQTLYAQNDDEYRAHLDHGDKKGPCKE